MVVPLIARNTHTNKEEQVYALLDSASDQSFITLSLAERLHLAPHSENTIIVNTFGGRAEKKHVRFIETLLPNSQGQSLYVRLLTTDNITNVLTIIELQPEDKHFLEENFSTPPEMIQDLRTEVVPDILLGIDYFNTILLITFRTIHDSHIFRASNIRIITINIDNSQPSQLYDNIISTYTTQGSFHGQPNMDYSDLWKLPGIGIDELQTNEELNKQIIANFCSTVQLKTGKSMHNFLGSQTNTA
ncbi:hypothetical protein OSTOST_02413 [Ostertagia ostertagi]